MLSPLIPDIRHPKWVIVVKLLEIIASPRANKIAGRLKIYDKDKFLLSIKVLILSDLFERDVSRLVSEINENISLKKLLGINSKVKADEIYKMQSNLEYELIFTFFKRLFQPRKRLCFRRSKIDPPRRSDFDPRVKLTKHRAYKAHVSLPSPKTLSVHVQDHCVVGNPI